MKSLRHYALSVLVALISLRLCAETAAGQGEVVPARVNCLLPSSTREVLKLDGDYEFEVDAKGVGEKEQWFRGGKAFSKKAKVPGALQAQGLLPDIATEFRSSWKMFDKSAGKIPAGWYRTTFRIPWTGTGKTLWLKMGGVHPGCKVWLNGALLGEHRGGFIPFKFDVTAVAKRGQDNILVVEMNEDIPAQALGGHYNKYGGLWSGIYRSIEIEQTAPAWIEDVHIRPDVAAHKAVVSLTVKNSGDAKQFAVAVEVSSKGAEKENGTIYRGAASVTVAKGQSASATLSVDIPGARLWSPQHPNLYEARIVLKDGDGEVDSVGERFGMCDRRTDKGRILLNGVPFYIRGCGDLCSYPLTYSPPGDREYYRREMRLARDYGFNYIRHHSWVPTEEYLDAADEAGVCIQIETASIGQWSASNKPPALEANWANVIRRIRNHPSVMTYCMGNEGGAQIDSKARMYRAAKELDPTRFVMATAHHESKSVKYCDIVETNLDKYADKPYFRHEYGHWSSFPDARLAGRFAGLPGGSPYWLAEAVESARKNGLSDLLEAFAVNSQQQQQVTRKYGIEYFRLKKPLADGYTLWLGKDSMYTMGMWTDFGAPKETTAAESRMSNGPTAILIDLADLDRTFESGQSLSADLYVHHTGETPIAGGVLEWALTVGDKAVASGKTPQVNLRPGDRKALAKVQCQFPAVEKPARCRLAATLSGAPAPVENQWDLWLFPGGPALMKPAPVVMELKSELKEAVKRRYPHVEDPSANPAKASAPGALLIADTRSKTVMDHLRAGGRVLLLARGCFDEGVKDVPQERINSKWVTFMTGSNYWGSSGGHTLGTIIAPHSAMGAFPHEGWCDFSFAGLLWGATTLRLKAWPAPVDTIVRAIDCAPACAPLAYMVETNVGEGRLLATTFAFDFGEPECAYLFDALLRYSASDAFHPRARLTVEQFERLPASTGKASARRGIAKQLGKAAPKGGAAHETEDGVDGTRGGEQAEKTPSAEAAASGKAGKRAAQAPAKESEASHGQAPAGFSPVGVWVRKNEQGRTITLTVFPDGAFKSTSGGSGKWEMKNGAFVLHWKDSPSGTEWQALDRDTILKPGPKGYDWKRK